MTIPVTMLAGFLGSGKTTLVRRALSEARERGERIAVVVNEFGDLGIDGELVVRDGGDGSGSIVELAGGCICCEIQEDLRTALLDLARAIERSERRGVRWLRRRRGPIARVLVEASGAASPGAAVQTLLIDGDLAEHMHLDGVVTLCHAALVLGQLAERPEAAQQIAYADRIVVNHADRVPADELERVRVELAALNPLAEVRTATRADVDLGWVLAPRASGGPRSGAHPVHAHTAGLVAVALEDPRRVDRDALRIWLEFLSARRGAELMRAKGILRVPGGAVEVQGIHRWLELHPLAGEEPGASRLVLIGTGLDPDELRRGWEAVLV